MFFFDITSELNKSWLPTGQWDPESLANELLVCYIKIHWSTRILDFYPNIIL